MDVLELYVKGRFIKRLKRLNLIFGFMNNFKLHHISNNQVLRCSVAAHLKLVSRILNIDAIVNHSSAQTIFCVPQTLQIVRYTFTVSNGYESLTVFVFFQKYPSVPKTCGSLISSGNDGINILLVELIKERFRVLHGKRLQHLFSMPGKENFTWCGFWWDEMLSSGQYKEKSLYLAVMFEDTLLAPINDMQLYRV
ncbi:unnamed protein product [Lactuca saligna]|uniref:Uncharacterized protein n=1 Tax=Lactuca saligna TaxID=75948 RepID=A0AA36E924_LACSI|nr:unnamed protein product [Lactuca saligna]